MCYKKKKPLLVETKESQKQLVFIRNEQKKLSGYFSSIHLSRDFTKYEQVSIKKEDPLANCATLIMSFGTSSFEKYECLRVIGQTANRKKIPILFNLEGLCEDIKNIQLFEKLSNDITYKVIYGSYVDVMGSAGFKVDKKVQPNNEMLKKIARVYQCLVIVKEEDLYVSDGETVNRLKLATLTRTIYDLSLLEALVAYYLSEFKDKQPFKNTVSAIEHFLKRINGLKQMSKMNEMDIHSEVIRLLH